MPIPFFLTINFRFSEVSPPVEETPAEAPKEEKKEEEKPEKVRLRYYSASWNNISILSRLQKEKEFEKAVKVGRRLSARLFSFKKSGKTEEHNAPAKVDENPPKIDEPEPVAPLDNPATEAAAPVAEEPKPAEPTPVTPVVAAAA